MSSERQSFLEAAVAAHARGDMTPVLALADWAEEHGEPALCAACVHLAGSPWVKTRTRGDNGDEVWETVPFLDASVPAGTVSTCRHWRMHWCRFLTRYRREKMTTFGVIHWSPPGDWGNSLILAREMVVSKLLHKPDWALQ